MARSELSRFMSQYLPDHPEIEARVSGVADPAELASLFASEGARAGFAFDAADVTSVLAEHPSRELGDEQLEGVAGGKTTGRGRPEEYFIMTLKEAFITG